MNGRLTRAGLVPAAALIVVALLAGLAYNVRHSEKAARTGIEAEFARRATLAADLTISALTSTTPDQLQASFGGPVAGLPAAMREFQSFNPDPRAAILDARGKPLVSWPPGSAAGDLARLPIARAALRGRFSISDLHGGDDADSRLLTLAAPFDTPSGRRIGVEVVPAAIIESFASAYLANAPAVRGGRGYLIDGKGRVLASSQSIAQGRALPDAALARALRSRTKGSLGGRFFAASSLAGTGWRVVLSTPRDELFASVQGSTRSAAWLLYGALVIALAALVATCTSALRKSGQLAASREREQASRRLAHERLHDSLTGLPTRALFLDRADQALALASRDRRALAVLLVDVDRFARINDSLGHASGDELLAMIPARLRKVLAPDHVISRYGADEFLVLCTGLGGTDDALQIANRLIDAFDEPFELAGRSVHITCSVGIAAHLPSHPVRDAASLVRNADAAKHRAKTRGPSSLCVSDSALHGDALTRLDTELALRDALGNGDLRLFYQPIVALPGGRIRGVEALVRWQRPGVGLLPPAAFVPLAEESGLIVPIGAWVLESAMADVAAWQLDGLLGPDFVLSVNVSACQLADGELPAIVRALLERWSLDATHLWLEITESAVAADAATAQREISALSALGLHVAIDDFGVGQSSLEQLVHSLPVDVLKLDRSFTGHLADFREHAVAAAIAPLARALRMTAVAEGVVTAAQAEQLATLGYPLAQGFHFGRPAGAEQTRELLIATARVARDAPPVTT
jgi:diguanylate cyclase (GGDEF)-like protein